MSFHSSRANTIPFCPSGEPIFERAVSLNDVLVQPPVVKVGNPQTDEQRRPRQIQVFLRFGTMLSFAALPLGPLTATAS